MSPGKRKQRRGRRPAREAARPSLAAGICGLASGAPGFAQLLAALDAGRSVVVEGTPPGARAACVAALARSRGLLCVLPDAESQRSLAEDLRFLLEGQGPPLENPGLSLYEDEETGEALSEVDVGARLRVLRALQEEPGAVVLTSASALLQRLPAPARIRGGVQTLAVGDLLDPHALALRLVEHGYRRVTLVETPGEFAIRGGIFDLFALGAETPLRFELFGDELESIRRFEPASQRSLGEVPQARLTLLASRDLRTQAQEDATCLVEHLPAAAALVLLDPEPCRERLAQAATRFAGHAADQLAPAAVEAALAARGAALLGAGAAGDPLAEAAEQVELPFIPAGLDAGRGLEAVTNALGRQIARGERLTLACVNEAERERLLELFADGGLSAEAADALRVGEPPGLSLVVAPLARGLRTLAGGGWLLPSSRIFGRHRRSETVEARLARGRRRGPVQTAVESFADLELGQPVVHVSYGIALFQGIVRREREGKPRDFLRLEFDGGELYIPTDRIGLVRRYVGPTTRTPRLSKLGGKGWQKKTKKATEAVRDLAAELLEVQAERQVRPGFAFPPDDRLQLLFEESFPYTDTPDQIRVTQEVKRDMEAPRAMDRIVCGDVGYGKTEIAVRAAFKCASSGRQVAVLAPTTILAHQHHRTFSERVAAYPIRVEVISRFLSRAEQKRVLKDALAGQVDVLIGTHRLLSQDVRFKDLGLIVVDEEQRFGVADKERIKAFRRTVDILTLTATPIPRTLHMALSGARDISVLQTPPPGRSAVETKVCRFAKPLIKRAIERELARDGQVFFVHDRVRTIGRIQQLVKELVPTARVLVVHGQMAETSIEERMLKFFEHEADVLVATTLIENGLDVRRANTLLVDRADRFGLAELHQIRGRVGRSSVRAYAYCLIEEQRVLSDIARRRLRAIEEYTELGAGFHIAMRDLEIRGAGNVLGAEQSGHIVNVGYDLYCRLLKRAMAELTGQLARRDLNLERDLDLEAGEIEVVLDVPAYVPDAYVADAALKIDCYRKLAAAEEEHELGELAAELRDRFGPLPRVLENLFQLRRLRLRAAGLGVLRIARQDRVLQLRCRSRTRLEQGVRAHHQALRPIDEHMLYVRMQDADAPDEAQLALLLELLTPLPRAPQRSARGLNLDKVRRERKRRMRARAAKEEQAAEKAARGPRGKRRGRKKSSPR